MSARNSGFTVVELLVAIAIVGLLVALLLPAVQQARESARKTQCLSQMRQVGLALVQHGERVKRFPALGYWSETGSQVFHSWIVEILPGIEQGALFEQWDFNQPNDDVTNSNNGNIARTPLSMIVCPSDTTVVDGRGNQSFVVNAGIGWTKPADCPFSIDSQSGGGITRVHFDLSGDGIACPETVGQDDDRQILKTMGVFFAENRPVGSGTVRHHRRAPVSRLDSMSVTSECRAHLF